MREPTGSAGTSETLAGRIQRWLYLVEDGVLIGLLLAMMLLAAAQILLRNVFGAGIVWGDVAVRILVLWVGLMGAMVAGRKGEHIKIDILSRHLAEKPRVLAETATDLFTAAVCATAAFYSAKFVYWEYVDGFTAFASVPVWVCEAVIPLTFGATALRYAARTFQNALSFFKTS